MSSDPSLRPGRTAAVSTPATGNVPQMAVRPFVAADKATWDAFVDTSKNGTFLHRRAFVEYHHTRFEDASLVIEDERGTLAVLAANRVDALVTSHAGLTYGSLVTDERMTAVRMLALFEELRRYLSSVGVRRVEYKTVPYIYHRTPADEDLYALFRVGARLVRRDLLTVVARDGAPQLRRGRLDGIRKARRAGLAVVETPDYSAFWSLLEVHLCERHDAVPVHSLTEIRMLVTRFPDKIRLYGVTHEGALIAGCVLFVTDRVAHVQYIASNAVGRRLGALDLLFHELMAGTYSAWPYFDFGASTTDDGRVLNEGLAFQKEGFGGRSVVQDFYCWELAGGS